MKTTSSLILLALLIMTLSPELRGQSSPQKQQRETAAGDSLETLDEIIMERITVTGTPERMSRIPGAATYLGSVELQKHNYTDVNRLLRGVSGVYIQEEEGYGLRPNIGIRGTGSERSSKINMMEDGILAAPAPYSAPAAYYFPNIARMSAIEVRKGSSQIKHGPNTTGGALNMISTPIPIETSGVAELSVGERASNRLYGSFGNRTDRFGYLVEATHVGDNGFKELDSGGGTGFSVKDILGKFMVHSSADASLYQRLELKLGYHDETSDETYLGITRDDFEESPYRRYAASQMDEMNTRHTQIMARHFMLLSDQVDVTTTAYRNDFSRAWYKLHQLNANLPEIETGGLHQILSAPELHQTEFNYLLGASSPDNALTVRNNSRDYFAQGIESIVGFKFDAARASNQLEAGVRLHQDQEDRFQENDHYRMESGRMILTTEGTPGTQDNRIGSATALAVFLQDRIEWEDWTVTPGIRFENIWFRNRNYGTVDLDRTGSDLVETEYLVQVFVPGIGISWQAADRLHLFTGVHRGFSPPGPSSSSDTKSESSVNYELGFRYVDSALQTEVVGFYNDYSNLLGSDLAAGGGTGTTARFNAGQAEVYGVELAADLEIAQLLNMSSAHLSIPLNLNYTYTVATFLSSFESDFGPWGSVEVGDRIPFIPEHQFRAGVHLNYRDFSVGVNSIYSPAMRTVAGSGSLERMNSTDSYLLLDLSTSYQVLESVNLFVNVRNLLDRTYIVSDRPSGVRPGLPRTAMAGVRFQM